MQNAGKHGGEQPEPGQGNGGGEPQDKNPDPKGKPQTSMWMHQLVWLVTMGLFIYFWANLQEGGLPEIDYTAFKNEISMGNVAQVVIKEKQVTGEFKIPAAVNPRSKEPVKRFTTILPDFVDAGLLQQLEEQEVKIKVVTSKSPTWLLILGNMVPWLLLLGLFLYSGRILQGTFSGGAAGGGRAGNLFSFSQSKAKKYEAETIKTGFNDVAGLEAAKQDLQEVVDFLKRPEKYRALGAKMPKGILMMGPPGCGKTLLARATAGEAGVPFFSVSGSEFIEMFVGVGASRVRDMFENARKSAPALIFIDEIDSVGRSRGTGLGGGNDEREQTLNQILAEMDGFSGDEAVVVIAATNRPDVLDSALLRPGRFDRKLVLELPGQKARFEILKVHTRRVPIADDVDLEQISRGIVGFSGADIANLVNEAALNAARADRHVVTSQDFDEARDKIVLGSALQELLNDEEKQRVAYHEAGHALTSLLLKSPDPLSKITIVPHGRAMGMTELIPEEERHNFTQDYLEKRLSILLGGRAAEKLQYNEVSTGAQDDLKKATQLARQMISQWGMSERVGPVNLQQSEEHPFLGREIATPTHHSEHSAQLVDEEVSNLIKVCEQRSVDLLTTHKSQLQSLADTLIEKESLSGEEVHALLGDL